ncbi:hypothetical protein EIP86_007309 [Pleurotus ostreatoroseus]|nr:hypothetical protein EIP86_007309 [Pleurotus ostreatoroseus]
MEVNKLLNLTSANRSSRSLGLQHIPHIPRQGHFIDVKQMSNSIPPGITYEGKLLEVQVGAKDASWQWAPYQRVKLFTNAFIVQNGKILLGYKKRGFGQGIWNGFGGKVEPQETTAQAAARELKEEAGIDAPLKHCGTLFFTLEGVEYAFHIELFVANKYTGVITESDEMRPEWYSTGQEPVDPELPPIPYDKMWADDIVWMPLLLAERPFVGRADFTANNTMERWWFAEKVQ